MVPAVEPAGDWKGEERTGYVTSNGFRDQQQRASYYWRL